MEDLEKKTVKDLKKLCKEIKLVTQKTKKSDIIEEIKKHLENKKDDNSYVTTIENEEFIQNEKLKENEKLTENEKLERRRKRFGTVPDKKIERESRFEGDVDEAIMNLKRKIEERKRRFAN